MSTAEQSKQLSELVRSIDGVITVYDPRPAALAAAVSLVTTVIGQPAAEPIAITTSPEGVSVAVSVAISDSHPAAEVCERILDAVSGYFEETTPGEKVDVKIQVARINYDVDVD